MTGGTAAGLFSVNAEAALIELELSWRPAGNHDFRFQDGVYSARPGDEDVFTGGTPDALGQEIRKNGRCGNDGRRESAGRWGDVRPLRDGRERPR